MRLSERGGIISKLIIIPAGIALMIGFFFLGYYVGKYQGKQGAAGEKMPPLPDLVTRNLPKPEEYTFYKTLTEKDGKSVSIELKPKTRSTEAKAEKKQQPEPRTEGDEQPARAPETAKAEKKEERRKEKPAAAEEPKQAASAAAEKKSPQPKAAAAKLRYTVQVSAHQEKEAAADDVRRLKQNGFAAAVVASDVPGKGKWYRVRIGSFAKKESAEKLQKDILAKAGLESIVVLE